MPAVLLAKHKPFDAVTRSRLGSYWNLVMPYALASGFFEPHGTQANEILRYMLAHGSRLLGLVRAGAYSLYGGKSRYPVTGTDQVYGLAVARFLADNDQPDQLVLSLYGMLGAAMTPGTFVSGEAATVAPLARRGLPLDVPAAERGLELGVPRDAAADARARDDGAERAAGRPRARLRDAARLARRRASRSPSASRRRASARCRTRSTPATARSRRRWTCRRSGRR